MFEPEFTAALTDIFEQRIAFNRLLGLRIGTLAGDGLTGQSRCAPNSSATTRTTDCTAA